MSLENHREKNHGELQWRPGESLSSDKRQLLKSLQMTQKPQPFVLKLTAKAESHGEATTFCAGMCLFSPKHHPLTASTDILAKLESSWEMFHSAMLKIDEDQFTGDVVQPQRACGSQSSKSRAYACKGKRIKC
ncbi:uncharacterized [Tachysurus ichikawai]